MPNLFFARRTKAELFRQLIRGGRVGKKLGLSQRRQQLVATIFCENLKLLPSPCVGGSMFIILKLLQLPMKKLGIIPIVDFAFAKVFMTPSNKVALIALLNAILVLRARIVDITLLNPFNYKDFADDNLSILDVKAVDADGRIFSVEMQLTVHAGLMKRILYYGCESYVDQLREGEDYSSLRPVYAICIIDGRLW